MFLRGRKSRVAQLKTYPINRQAERVRSDLRRRGVGARPHVGGGTAYGHGPVGEKRGGRGCWIAGNVVNCSRHAEPHQVATDSHGARLGHATMPAEPFRSLLVTVTQRFGGPRQILHWIFLGIISQAQFDRVELQLLGQLVHRHLLPDQAGRPARAPHGAGRADIHRHQAVTGSPVRTGVGGGCSCERGFSKLLISGGLTRDLVNHGGEPAAAIGTEGHSLPRFGTEADRSEELSPSQLQPHRTPGTPRGHGC